MIGIVGKAGMSGKTGWHVMTEKYEIPRMAEINGMPGVTNDKNVLNGWMHGIPGMTEMTGMP